MKTIGILTTILVTVVLSSLWSGYVLSILWRWFIVPPFGAPPLTVGYAIGVAIVVGYLVNSNSPPQKEEDEWSTALIKGIAIDAVRPACALLIGWIVTLFL